MQPPAGVLTREEKAVLALRELYRSYGYRRYRIDKFEPYDLYRDNKDFLGEETAITFPDSRGRLMALKPDVTMSIVNDYRPDGRARKWHYTENVFRRGATANSARSARSGSSTWGAVRSTLRPRCFCSR